MHFAAGKYGIALGQFEEALQAQPDSVRALNAIAATYDQLQNFELADQYYLRAVQLAPSSPDVLNNIGYSHALQGDLAAAASYFARAKQLDPENGILDANIQLVQSHQQALAANAAADRAVPPPVAAPSMLFAPEYHEQSAMAVQPLTGSHFVRVAPGVQMLVTRPAPPASIQSDLASVNPSEPAKKVAAVDNKPLYPVAKQPPIAIGSAVPLGTTSGAAPPPKSAPPPPKTAAGGPESSPPMFTPASTGPREAERASPTPPPHTRR